MCLNYSLTFIKYRSLIDNFLVLFSSVLYYRLQCFCQYFRFISTKIFIYLKFHLRKENFLKTFTYLNPYSLLFSLDSDKMTIYIFQYCNMVKSNLWLKNKPHPVYFFFSFSSFRFDWVQTEWNEKAIACISIENI